MRRSTGLLAILGVVLATGLWYLFIFSPINARIAALGDEVQAAEDEALTLRTTLDNLRKIQESELAYIAAVGTLEAAVPPTPELAALIDQLDVLKEEAGIDWISLTPSEPQVVEGQVYLEIPLAVSIEGQYFEVLGYLYGLAELERLVVVDSVTLSTSEDEEGMVFLTVAIGARTFTTGTLGPAPPPAATTTTVPGATTTSTTVSE